MGEILKYRTCSLIPRPPPQLAVQEAGSLGTRPSYCLDCWSSALSVIFNNKMMCLPIYSQILRCEDYCPPETIRLSEGTTLLRMNDVIPQFCLAVAYETIGRDLAILLSVLHAYTHTHTYTRTHTHTHTHTHTCTHTHTHTCSLPPSPGDGGAPGEADLLQGQCLPGHAGEAGLPLHATQRRGNNYIMTLHHRY